MIPSVAIPSHPAAGAESVLQLSPNKIRKKFTQLREKKLLLK